MHRDSETEEKVAGNPTYDGLVEMLCDKGRKWAMARKEALDAPDGFDAVFDPT